ncbi:MAG: preprotein translocase subunit Sec61beta [Candidatus Micrarchaeota archaeon]|nr:preprotein translocase subunit Sec61beta [Candidatus Micrarchaeota archaeon]
MAQETITQPRSSTGIISFYNEETGGPQLDPRSVLLFSVLVILIIEIYSLMS